jgi:hypothetical protein
MYWFLSQDLKIITTKEFHGNTPSEDGRLWTAGQKFDSPYPPEEFEVATRHIGFGIPDGDEMPDFFDSTVPLMSARLLKVLKSAGVDNIDSYPVKIVDKAKGLSWDDYRAVNVVGCVDALDRQKTKSELDIETNALPTYTSVAIDPARALGLLCFRLDMGPGELVLHEKVAQAVAQGGFTGLLLVRTVDFDQRKD